MNIQVLVTTMNSDANTKICEMNLCNANVIVANQNGCNSYKEWKQGKEKTVKVISTNTIGVSINRNIAISHSDADIVVFSDDDQVFLNDFEAIVSEEFQNHPKAEAIKFYCESTNKEKPLSFARPKSFKKANLRIIMSAGVPALAVKRSILEENNFLFSEKMGPGKHYFLGEDSVFLKQLMDANIAVYVSPLLLSYVKQDKSSWFNGYTDQYFISIGYAYAKIYNRAAIVMALRRAWKLRKKAENRYSVWRMVCLMKVGIYEYWQTI